MSFKSFLSAVLIAFVVLSFQNCGQQQFEVQNFASEAGTGRLTGETVACENNSLFQACIIAKNIVYQERSTISASQINNYRKLGIVLPSLTNSQNLQSSDFVVRNSEGNTPQSNNWKAYSAASPGNLSHVMSYYYAQDFKNKIFNRLPGYSWGNNTLIYTDSSFSGFLSKKNEIHLESETGRNPMAVDGSLIVNFTALAFAHKLSSGQLHIATNQQANSCSNQKGRIQYSHCCKTASGCGAAIAVGAADYFSAIYFEANSWNLNIGESWVNATAGAAHCQISRNIESNSALSMNSAFQACSGRGSSGWIYNMGTAYASTWWQIRKLSGNSLEIDRLFAAHIKEVTGSDTFTSALNKARSLDSSLYAGKYSSLITQTFSSRGLQ